MKGKYYNIDEDIYYDYVDDEYLEHANNGVHKYLNKVYKNGKYYYQYAKKKVGHAIQRAKINSSINGVKKTVNKAVKRFTTTSDKPGAPGHKIHVLVNKNNGLFGKARYAAYKTAAKVEKGANKVAKSVKKTVKSAKKSTKLLVKKAKKAVNRAKTKRETKKVIKKIKKMF